VAEERGRIIGCSALHISWENLAEIKSLAVTSNKQRKGIGRELILVCLKEAKNLGAKKVFALTYRPDFFKKFGFRRIKNSALPHKIWAECCNCPKFPDCKEIAVMREV
jgi:amino-acid N-acetyltransferase